MILVNGAADGTLPATDRGLAYGDGVFRTFPMRGGSPQCWPSQFSALHRDCSRLGIACPGRADFERDIARLGTELPDAAVKLIVTRGTGLRGYRPPARPEAVRIAMAMPLSEYPADYAMQGVRVRRCALRLSHQPALAGVKHLNRLENVLARAEWQDDRIAEGLLCDEGGLVIGGTMTNLFLVESGALVTPVLTQCGVAGVTRERVIAAARDQGVTCREEPVEWPRLLVADEILLTNSLIGVWPVRDIDGAARATGPMAGRVRHWLAAARA